MITSKHFMFRESPITFNIIGMIFIIRHEMAVMINRFMNESIFFKSFVAFPAISINRTSFFHMLFNERAKSGAFNIRNNNCSNSSVPLDNPNYRSFPCSASASLSLPASPKVSLINFYITRQLRSHMISLYSFSYTIKHLPSHLVGYFNFIFELISCNSYFKKPNGQNPLGEWRSGLIKYRSTSLSKFVVTARTFILKITTLSKIPNPFAFTSRTINSIWPTCFIKKFNARFFVSYLYSVIVKPHIYLLSLNILLPSIQEVPLRG